MKLLNSCKIITSIDYYQLFPENEDIYLEHKVTENKETFLLQSKSSKVYPVIVDDNFQNFLKTQNPFHNSGNWHKNSVSSLEEAKSLTSKNVLYVRLNDHCLFDLDMNVIPQVLTLDYISCPITTCKSKNINQMLKILSKNEFILNKDKIGLSLVPYCNNTSGNEEMIVNKQNIYREELKILLAKETYQEIYNIAMTNHKHASPNILKQILFKNEKDFLGVRHLINEEFLYIF